MKYFIFILLFFIGEMIYAQSYTKEELQTVKEEGDSLNGRRNDLWKEFYADKKLKSVGEYIPGGPDMIIIQDPDRALEKANTDTMSLKIEIAKYSSFKKGEWRYYWPNGKLMGIENYLPVFYCTVQLELDATGATRFSYNKPASWLHGLQQSFFENGKLKYEAKYVNGNYIYERHYDEKGNLESEEKAVKK